MAPVSYTAPPIEPRTSHAPPEPIAKPLLASEALMDDLAPVQPARAAARLWCAAMGVGCLALGALPLVGARVGGLKEAGPAFVLAPIALLAALARVGYRQRAVAMIALGALCVAFGLFGFGPADGIGVGGGTWGLLRVLSATLLPAALLFRARYRAFAGARWILGAAFGATLPFAGYAALLLASGNAFGIEQIGAGVALAAVLAGLFGFMGAETTAAASYTAFGIILGHAIELALEALGRLGPSEPTRIIASVVISATAFAAVTSIVALGLFQVLASRFAADARRIDLHKGPAKEKPLGESGEWSTRAE